YFETLTAIAYLWFADKPVGLGVFEVGMGGAWDATNLILGDVAVLCPIGLDHTAILGTTVREIATEKAGIIKEGRVGIVREQRDALRIPDAGPAGGDRTPSARDPGRCAQPGRGRRARDGDRRGIPVGTPAPGDGDVRRQGRGDGHRDPRAAREHRVRDTERE